MPLGLADSRAYRCPSIGATCVPESPANPSRLPTPRIASHPTVLRLPAQNMQLHRAISSSLGIVSARRDVASAQTSSQNLRPTGRRRCTNGLAAGIEKAILAAQLRGRDDSSQLWRYHRQTL